MSASSNHTTLIQTDLLILSFLKRNLKVMEVRFKKKSGQVSTEEKRWYVSSPPGGQIQLVIGGFGHPVEKSGATIRLQNNYDLGMYYERIR